MPCSQCGATATTDRPDRTALGERRFRWRACNRGVHERTGTLCPHLPYPPEVVCLVVLWRFRSKRSVRDLGDRFLQRRLVFTPAAVRDWEVALAPRLTAAWRKRRRGAVGPSWDVDETSIHV